MIDVLWLVLCGVTAGLLGGYLGLGGGIVIVPFMTIILGIDISLAVPVSVTAIVINSFASSNEYLKKGMVDMELVILLSTFMILGGIIGSASSRFIPGHWVQLILAAVLLYTAVTLLKGRKSSTQLTLSDSRFQYIAICTVLALVVGAISGLVGIGGGAIIIPLLHLVIGMPFTTARGTSSLMVGSSSAAAAAVYYFNGSTDVAMIAPVAFGILLGGKLGGYLGTMAKPAVVKFMFFIIMLYLAWKLGMPAYQEIFG